jgi:hypothetical protein
VWQDDLKGASGNVNYLKLPSGVMHAWGYLAITPVADTVTTSAVSFVKAFTATPSITISASTTSTAVKNTSHTGAGTSGFSAGVYRTNTTETGVHWVAMGYWR